MNVEMDMMNKRVIQTYQDLVVQSSTLNINEINTLARELCDTIRNFEEIHYLLSDLTRETLEYICLARIDLLVYGTDINYLKEHISAKTYTYLLDHARFRGQ